VGRASFDLVDPNRAEIYSTNPQDRRELVIWAWYPAAPGPDAKRAAYLPEPWAPAGQLFGLDAAGLLSHAVAEAPVADERSSYPVLVQSQSGFPPLLLAAIAEELASHGYVVVGVNHTYESAVTVFADGRAVAVNPEAQAGVLGPQTGPYQERFRQRAAVCDYKAADLASVADQLERLPADAAGLLGGRLDLSRLGSFGHSFGGNAALQWCRNDRRCRAAANLDGALWTEVGRVGLDRPVLQLLAEHPEFARSGADAVTGGGHRRRSVRHREVDHLRRLADGARPRPSRLHRAGHGGDPCELHGCGVTAAAGGGSRPGDACRDQHRSTADVAGHMRRTPRLLRHSPRTRTSPIPARGPLRQLPRTALRPALMEAISALDTAPM
jgi:dienelactone hydrolase